MPQRWWLAQAGYADQRDAGGDARYRSGSGGRDRSAAAIRSPLAPGRRPGCGASPGHGTHPRPRQASRRTSSTAATIGDRRVRAEQREAVPGGERVRVGVDRGDRLAGAERQVGVDRVAPAVGQDRRDARAARTARRRAWRCRRRCCGRGRRCATPEQPGDRQEQRGPDDRAQRRAARRAWSARGAAAGSPGRRRRRRTPTAASARAPTAERDAAFAHSTGSRCGTAAKVERIMPVEYSPVITSTPSTPIASCAMCQPPRLASTGLKVARSWGSSGPVRHLHARRRRCRGRPSPTTATSSEQRVERRIQSFVHSERTTRAWVTRADVDAAPGSWG